MSSFWLKIWIWIKVSVFALLALYILIFVIKNNDNTAKFWFWPYKEYETGVLLLALSAFAAGIIGTILVRTTIKTLKQISDVRKRGRTERLEREVADMRTKAAMLQTRGGPADDVTSVEP